MSKHSLKKNGGSVARSVYLNGVTAVTAGGAGDNTAINSAWTDRALSNLIGMAGSAKVVVAWTTTLAANKTLSLAFKVQDADDNSGTNSADAGVDAYPNGAALTSTVVQTDTGSGGTYTGTTEFDVNLTGLRQFVRSVVTPDLNASGTDTASVQIVGVLFGSDRGPISKSLV